MFSLIIPVYNEEDLIVELATRSIKAVESFAPNYEILFIDDGSTDSTLQKLIELRKHHSRIKIVELSKNFGHQAAFTAGLEMARGNIVAMMDGDLQDPPELLPKMMRLMDDGCDVVYGRRRVLNCGRYTGSGSAGAFPAAHRHRLGLILRPELPGFRDAGQGLGH